MKSISFNRSFMKADYESWKGPANSDQMNGIPAPPLQKAPKPDAEIIPLKDVPLPDTSEMNLFEILHHRRSVRQYALESLTLSELSFLLESTSRVQKILGDHVATFRPAPSGGARHPFETYLAIIDVDGITPGLYHYLPLSHELELLKEGVDLDEVVISVNGQKFAGTANVVFYYSAIPYRAEWRYGLKSHKVMLLDAGHLGQNLYLAAEAISAGACAIASYDQEKADALFDLDGEDEFIIYIIPVGKKA